MAVSEFMHTQINGSEKNKYLSELDSALLALEKDFAIKRNSYISDRVAEIAKREGWDLDRLPSEDITHLALSRMIGSVREEYSWLDWKTFPGKPLQNRGYFDQITINSETGLPWAHDFIALRGVQQSVHQRMAKEPSFSDFKKRLEKILMEDKIEIESVRESTAEVHKSAMRSNYLKIITGRRINSTTLGFENSTTTKTLDLGAEVLWNIQILDHSLATGMFQLYVLDAWQDNLSEPQIIEAKGQAPTISEDLRQTMKFSESNSAWYALKEIDISFPSLHPVQLSMLAIGPFENRYQKRAGQIGQLEITRSILTKDLDASILRATRKYSYAPNHSEIAGVVRQQVYNENWEDVIIVAQAKYAAEIAGSIEGSSVRIIQR